MKQVYFLLGFIIILSSCNPPPIGKKVSKEKSVSEDGGEIEKTEISEKGYILALSKIDNSVRVYINDSIIYNSGTIHDSPEVDFQVDLTALIKDGSEMLKIELYNGLEPYESQIDPLWEIRYDFIIDGQIVDFVHEYGDDNAIGKVYETTYVINEWKAL